MAAANPELEEQIRLGTTWNKLPTSLKEVRNAHGIVGWPRDSSAG